jgi:hypothetical protein
MTQADRIQSAVLICGVFAFVAGADAGVTECRPCGARAVSFGSTAVACGTCGSALSTTCSPSHRMWSVDRTGIRGSRTDMG